MMGRTSLGGLCGILVIVVAAALTPSCSCSRNPSSGGMDGGNRDSGGGGDGAMTTACGDHEPSCTSTSVGPGGMPPSMFPLPGDDPRPPQVGSSGIGRDPNGYLVLDSTRAVFDYLWIADDTDYGVGFVSKINSKPFATGPKYREIARYVTFTCQSDPVQGAPIKNAAGARIVLGQDQTSYCDGAHGCCTRAEWPLGGVHQAINIWQNRPSRTTVDFNGDVWVANRAHEPNPRQPSVTKIANKNNSISDTDCIDRNHDGIIETSSDVNGDGIITTDCDANGLPDDASTVCTGGRAHEFYGLDDECILFTTNIGGVGEIGRPMTLGPGGADYRPSDAWAGTYTNGAFYRIDGTTGAIRQRVDINAISGVIPHPYGAAIDKFGVLWAPNFDEPNLFYFDTNNPSNQGLVQATGPAAPPAGNGFYGIAIDGYVQPPNTDQQVWLAEWGSPAALRYRPKRDGTFAGLGMGTWARAIFPNAAGNGRGVGVDNRTPTAFAWIGFDGSAQVGRVPTNIADNMVTSFSGAGDLGATGQSGTLGTGVAADLDIWAINQGSSNASHFSVNAAGQFVAAADTVNLDDNPLLPDARRPHPYTYSDFTGFGLRTFTNPRGYYQWTETGCGPMRTHWVRVEWDASVPVGTSLTMRARAADTVADLNMATFTGSYDTSPADLTQPPGPLSPDPSGFLQVEFDFATQVSGQSPALRSFRIIWECTRLIP